MNTPRPQAARAKKQAGGGALVVRVYLPIRLLASPVCKLWENATRLGFVPFFKEKNSILHKIEMRKL